ncbi:MAG: GPW/gp25 family protein [Synergistaceae bacterium]|nr:GPW/gp25 family protein [Synergistaceae bacterium]MBQ6738147.1 GPW/gp25 family protein [Synergistaceae bacterium]MBR0075150.1 GPW/gp25 family protein [Synergistaceae bacterium]MBR0079432.1 GPW/gp25 family protein [Synergistaceae bacterium]MBR0234686.1 GPW/gp25 family protein [Synergistaceae bacterium]
MELDILTNEQDKINFAPKNIFEEIIQNIRTICKTVKYSVPLDRGFGVDAIFLDKPTPKACAMLQAEIISAIREYEPRCKVKKVTIEENLDGKLNIKLRIEI